jgi:hypothetical protein
MKNLSKKFTIGYIRHNDEVFARLLGPSIKNLRGDFDVVSVSDEKFPAENYNKLVSMAKTPYIILTHQDVTFSSDLLERINITIECVNDSFGALGMVGVDTHRNYHWSRPDIVQELDTADCCFLVIKTDSKIKFDESMFDEYHLYVEDYCAQMRRVENQSIYTISTFSVEANPNYIYQRGEGTFLNHHSNTCAHRGACWGRYNEYRNKLENKWPGIKTT